MQAPGRQKFLSGFTLVLCFGFLLPYHWQSKHWHIARLTVRSPKLIMHPFLKPSILLSDKYLTQRVGSNTQTEEHTAGVNLIGL